VTGLYALNNVINSPRGLERYPTAPSSTGVGDQSGRTTESRGKKMVRRYIKMNIRDALYSCVNNRRYRRSFLVWAVLSSTGGGDSYPSKSLYTPVNSSPLCIGNNREDRVLGGFEGPGV